MKRPPDSSSRWAPRPSASGEYSALLALLFRDCRRPTPPSPPGGAAMIQSLPEVRAEAPMADAATAYAAAGVAVFPCAEDKAPLTRGGFKDASADPDEVAQMWAARPAASIGAVPASAGCVVLDVDEPDALDRHPETRGLPETYRTRTRKGEHWWFRTAHAAEIGNTNPWGRGSGLDVRAASGYVIMPPSLHPDGGRYEQLRAPVADAPARLVSRLVAEPTPGSPDLEGAVPFADPRYEVAEPLARAAPGDRHIAHTRASGALARLVVGGYCSQAEALEALGWAATVNGMAAEGRLPEVRRILRGDIARLSEAELATPLGISDWREVFESASAEPDWLVDGLVERGRLHAVVGPAKSGKSLLMQELAVALACGRPTVAGRPVYGPADVLYVDEENAPSDWLARVQAFGVGDPADLGRLRLAHFTALDLTGAADAARLLAEADRAPTDLVVLDTVSRLKSGEENDSTPWQEMYRLVLGPLKARGIAVVRIDHTGKDASRGARGSSAKNDDVDVVWQVRAAGDGLVAIERTMSRQAHGLDGLTLRRAEDPLRHVPLCGAAQDADVGAEVAETARRLDELGVPLDASRRTATKALRDAGHGKRNETVQEALDHRRSQPGFDF